jgi:hypothetical protein
MWYVKRKEKQVGPFSLEQLKRYSSEGKLKPDDLLRKVDGENWVSASDAKGLCLLGIQSLISETDTPPELSVTNHIPPPLPATESGTSQLPWYHPLSLSALVIAIMFLYIVSSVISSFFPRRSRSSIAAASTDRGGMAVTAPRQKDIQANLKTDLFSVSEHQSIRTDRRLQVVYKMGFLTPKKLEVYLKMKAGMDDQWRDENSSTISNMWMLLMVPANNWPDASRKLGLTKQEYVAVTKWIFSVTGANARNYESTLLEMTGRSLQQY